MYKKSSSVQRANRSKGSWFPEAEGGTIIFVLLVSVMIIIGGFTALLKGASAGITYSTEFVPLANKPFLLTETLMRTQAGDRQFIEQAIESAAAGSLEGAGTAELIDFSRVFLKTYEIDNYRISIVTSDEIMSIDGFGTRCGEQGDGWCSSSCDVGYAQIDAAGACRPTQVCCKLDITTYEQTSSRTVVRCGGNGICSTGVSKTVPSYGGASYGQINTLGPYCNTGQVEIETNSCKEANNGQTPLCCVEKSNEQITNTINRARVPLLFKNSQVLGYLNVEVGIDD